MRLLCRCILLWMTRARRDVTELQPLHQLAHRAFMQLHPEFGGNLVTQVNQPPAHHFVPLWIRSLVHPFRHLLFLLGRQLAGRRAQIGPVAQPCQPSGVVAMHPVSQGLAVHPGTACRFRPALALQDQGQSQGSPCLRAVIATRRSLPKLRRRELAPRDPNRHVQASLPEHDPNRTAPLQIT